MSALLEHSNDAMTKAIEKAREEHRGAEELFKSEVEARSPVLPKVEAALGFFGSYSLLEVYSETLMECMRVSDGIEESLRDEKELWEEWERQKGREEREKGEIAESKTGDGRRKAFEGWERLETVVRKLETDIERLMSLSSALQQISLMQEVDMVGKSFTEERKRREENEGTDEDDEEFEEGEQSLSDGYGSIRLEKAVTSYVERLRERVSDLLAMRVAKSLDRSIPPAM